MFRNSPTEELVAISGTTDGVDWRHSAFLPHPLPDTSPELSAAAYRSVADARAALASLDATAARLPNPGLFRHSALRLEAQSTAALEGTYEPLPKVLAAHVDEPSDPSMREVLNYAGCRGRLCMGGRGSALDGERRLPTADRVAGRDCLAARLLGDEASTGRHRASGRRSRTRTTDQGREVRSAPAGAGSRCGA